MAENTRNYSQWGATFSTAAELSRRRHVVTLTLGNTPDYDLLCTSPATRTPYKIQVKGASGKNFVYIRKSFIEMPLQNDLFLIVVLVSILGEEGPAVAKMPIPRSPGGAQKAGVTASIVEFLKAASAKEPISREEILGKLCKRFPDRNRESMKSTVSQDCSEYQMKKQRGHDFQKSENGKRFWIATPQKSEDGDRSCNATPEKKADTASPFQFFILTHAESIDIWNADPKVLRGGAWEGINWNALPIHEDRWDKLPL